MSAQKGVSCFCIRCNRSCIYRVYITRVSCGRSEVFPSPLPGQDATLTCSGKSTDLLIREPAPGHVRHEDLRPGGGLSRDGAERVAAEEHRTQNHHLAETRLDRKSDELKMKNGFSFVNRQRDERERKKEREKKNRKE